MKYRPLIVSSLLALCLGGCSSSPIVGTWTGRGEAATTPFTFGSVSFVGDKTFTAEARYSGNARVQSGTWETKGNELHLTADKTVRDYTYKVEGKTLVVTDPNSKNSITLDRMAK